MNWSPKDKGLPISIFVYIVSSYCKNYSPKDVLLRPTQLWQHKQWRNMNTFVHFFFFFLFGGPWSESLLLPESELSEDEEEEVEEDELSSSLSLLLSLSSEEELEESLLSDDESLEEPSEPLLLSLESLDLRACGGVQINSQSSVGMDSGCTC